uniref:Putative transcriptional regulator protein n=1 Tax=uncultured bacterium pAB2 TaxID=1448270 RepID=W5VKD9_9BACT|nr:putative transcriptional regulator protein [uncultured bacterium pAB2]
MPMPATESRARRWFRVTSSGDATDRHQALSPDQPPGGSAFHPRCSPRRTSAPVPGGSSSARVPRTGNRSHQRSRCRCARPPGRRGWCCGSEPDHQSPVASGKRASAAGHRQERCGSYAGKAGIRVRWPGRAAQSAARTRG